MRFTSLKDFLGWATEAFLQAGLFFGHGTNNAWDEAVALARYVLGLPPDADKSVLERPLTIAEQTQLMKLAKERIDKRLPVPYLSHEAWFAGLKFYVDERVIIPRSPIAETIQQGFKPWLGKRSPKRILDLCTGSACIAIALNKVFPNAIIDAVDISNDALQVAQKNVTLHQCADKVHLIKSDLFSALNKQKYDIIISNPPYVDTLTLAHLPAEYRHEPTISLVAGKDGLKIVRRILHEAANYLNAQGVLIVEVGDSKKALIQAYPALPFIWLEFTQGGSGVFLLKEEDRACWQIS